MKAEGGAANGGVHANYVAGLVDLGASRDGMGWDGWMDGSPAHQRIPSTILTPLPLLEKISLVSRPSWLHPCKERRKLRKGRGEGKEQQQLLRGGLGHPRQVSFVRLLPAGSSK
jgi:hypothetical protein